MSNEIKLVFEPSVYLVGQQESVNSEIDRFLSDHDIENWTTDAPSSAEKLVETAGRLCYMSFTKPRPGGNEKYIRHILEVQHGSVCEHANWSFIFTGISRSCTHELVRHRHFNFSQLSQRYVDESDCEFVVPLDLQKEVNTFINPGSFIGTDQEFEIVYNAGLDWINSVEKSHQSYIKSVNYLFNKLIPKANLDLNKGIVDQNLFLSIDDMMKRLPIEKRTELRKTARQAARSLLPNATETKIFVTANARALRNFFELRGSRHAEPEIRVLASKVFDIIVKASPNLFGDYKKEVLEDGTFELTTPYKKM